MYIIVVLCLDYDARSWRLKIRCFIDTGVVSEMIP